MRVREVTGMANTCRESPSSFFITRAAQSLGWLTNEIGTYRQVSDFSSMEVVGGRKNHHHQAERQDGFHAPRLCVIHARSQLVCTAPDCCEGVWINLRTVLPTLV